jgi:hypothetical protein
MWAWRPRLLLPSDSSGSTCGSAARPQRALSAPPRRRLLSWEWRLATVVATASDQPGRITRLVAEPPGMILAMGLATADELLRLGREALAAADRERTRAFLVQATVLGETAEAISRPQ